jgi:hypothetical protein
VDSFVKGKMLICFLSILCLQGGIEKYLQEFPDGGYWQGKNFVFDKREAVGVGCVEGVGGIVQSAKDKTAKRADKADGAKDKEPAVKKAEVMGKCCCCDAPWDRYVGKRKCTMCGVPVLLCVSCSSLKGMLDKTDKAGDKADEKKGAAASEETGDRDASSAAAGKGDKDGKLSKRQRIKAAEAEKKRLKEEQFQQRLRVLRCPLCVAENCTVPADQVVFTANGTRAVYNNMEESEGGGYYEHSAPAAAAPAAVTNGMNKKIKFGEAMETVEAVPAAAVGKAAPTVCKWGGGYSAREEKGKSVKKRKLAVTTTAEGAVTKISRPCKFGSECTRTDCWFQH